MTLFLISLFQMFSPNGDNINDVYYYPVPYIELFDVQFMIYDRWGSLILIQTLFRFNGTLKGKNYTWCLCIPLKLVNKFSGVSKLLTETSLLLINKSRSTNSEKSHLST